MAASPLAVLQRWEQHGALWRLKTVSATRAVVELCTCYGEPVEELVVDDPEVIRRLAAQRAPGSGPATV